VKKDLLRIVPMTRSHIKACDTITAASDPWKTLNEGVMFQHYIALKQAYVCVAGDNAVGFIIFTPEPVFARGGYLRALGVLPSMQRQGIGEKLLVFAEKMTARSSRNFYLCVSDFNLQAQAFYKKQGYARAGKLVDLIVPGSSEYIYWKQLRPLSRKIRGAHCD
jgi:ribosomal protein S18 acetylase RimI-like enzyme